jgi:hypothetical protein
MAPPRFEPEPVAIESLAYDGQSIFAAEVLPIESLVPTDRMGLERGFDRYRALLASGAAAAQVRAAPAATGPEHVPAAATEDDVVDIGVLCYSGRGALERAAQIRAEIARHTRDARDLSGVEPLVRELLDLVPLALAG